jgi:hypothetical protein
MHLNGKKIFRIAFMLLSQYILHSSCFAINDPVNTQPLLGSQGQVQVNSSSFVTDYAYFNPLPLPAAQIDPSYLLIQNMVSVGIDEGNTSYIQSDFSVTIQLDIKTYDASQHLKTDSIKPFTINYSKESGTTYSSMQYYPFRGASEVRVTVVSIDSNVTWNVSKVLRIDNTLTSTRDYFFNCTAAISNLSVSLDAANQELTATWDNPDCGQTAYDLEWAWVDSSAISNYQDGNGNYIENAIFQNNASRVRIANNTYNIPLFYDGGGLLFVRVRPVQLKHTGQLIEGDWTWQLPASSNSVSTISNPPVFYSYGGHQNNLNWQASTSYAEEGKRKSVLQYFDGSLRGRQTVTKDNTTNTTIVAESFYDYQGRPVVQVLPAPTLNTIVQYSKNFNQSVNYNQYPGYPKWAYDELAQNASVCGNPATPLSTTSGASNYYSRQNPTITNPSTGYNANNYIPTSEGPDAGYAYPFTETRFAPDGRLASQSGVGYSHQIGSGHETEYYYESPSQQELDALFGTDAGEASHYFKNIVKDANGQYSVSYTDMHGRTIATALAGYAPSAMDNLPEYDSVNFTEQLLDNETNNVIGNSPYSSNRIKFFG